MRNLLISYDNKRITAFALLSFLSLLILSSHDRICVSNVALDATFSNCYLENAKRDILALMIAYPGWIANVELKDSFIYIVMSTGRRIVYDDLKVKSFEEKLTNADIQDMMELTYPLSFERRLPPPMYDPGRFRCYEFLMEVYGRNKAEVEQNLISVRTAFGTFKFNVQNGAAAMFLKAMSELSKHIAIAPQLKDFVTPLAGTYLYRTIAGTNLLSTHALGIAVDLNQKTGEYWQRASRESAEKRLQEYPEVIVRTFEKYGFIWGGKWYHFDLMHFEYRPELIVKSRYFSGNFQGKPWYGDLPRDSYLWEIQLVERAFGGG